MIKSLFTRIAKLPLFRQVHIVAYTLELVSIFYKLHMNDWHMFTHIMNDDILEDVDGRRDVRQMIVQLARYIQLRPGLAMICDVFVLVNRP